METNCHNHWRILWQKTNFENDSQILDNQHARYIPAVRTAYFNSLEHEIPINTYKNSVMSQETRFVSIRETNRLTQYRKTIAMYLIYYTPTNALLYRKV